MAARGQVVELRSKKTRRKTQSRRKKPDEWRAINRSHKAKDGRALLLAVPAPRRPGKLVVVEGYWCGQTHAWWLANTAPGLPGCDAIADVYGEPEMWMPMVQPPMREAA
jgi:hypothetical protein